MTKLTKRQKEYQKLVDENKVYALEEAVSLLKKVPHAKFDETVEVAFKLNADPKQSDQMIRGTVGLPHGTGKNVKVLVLCKGEGATAAKEAGADYVGSSDLIQKIISGWIDFDVVISAPDMMREVGKLGRVLGPRGLMPNPKTGTVTNDLAGAVRESKAGRIEFKLDKLGNINVGVGKISFEEKNICDNASVVIKAINKARPHGIKGKYIKNIAIAITMGPGIRLDLVKLGTT
ncbi:MAG: 50S ribosomal protein L1 [Candidatus Omnitrophica bacterium]|nr:50S ribosomal protein L1 [Candidatus Omnitrophota bacterium]MBU4457562.1 50S ribosomal protein L1 [Candidatus Omnitrophota bacterium]